MEVFGSNAVYVYSGIMVTVLESNPATNKLSKIFIVVNNKIGKE